MTLRTIATRIKNGWINWSVAKLSFAIGAVFGMAYMALLMTIPGMALRVLGQ